MPKLLAVNPSPERRRLTSSDAGVTESGVTMRSYCCHAGADVIHAQWEWTQTVQCWTFPPPTGIVCRATSSLVPRPYRCLGHLVYRRVIQRGRASHVPHARQPCGARDRAPGQPVSRWCDGRHGSQRCWRQRAELDVVGVARRPARAERVYLPWLVLLCGACRVARGGKRCIRLHSHRHQAGRLSRSRVAQRRA